MPTRPDTRTLPSLVTPLDPGRVLETLETASKRGRLPGFVRGRSDPLFRAAAFATPFDHELIASASTAGGSTRLTFRLRMLPRAPALFGLALIVSVWPGVHLVDQLLPASWGWISTHVYWWYLPLAILALLAWPAAARKSRTEAVASARETIARLAVELEARLEEARAG
jgi:hypothetical protein